MELLRCSRISGLYHSNLLIFAKYMAVFTTNNPTLVLLTVGGEVRVPGVLGC